MESVAVLKRPTIARDSAGGVQQDPFRTIMQNIPCSVQQAGAMIQQMFAQRGTVVDTTIFLAQDPGAEANDILVVTTRQGNALTYMVQGTVQPVGRARVWQVHAQFVPLPGGPTS